LTNGIGRVTGGVPPATRMMGGFRVAHFFVFLKITMYKLSKLWYIGYSIRRKYMYTIQYFDTNNNNLDTSSPKFPTIQLLVDFINQNPNLEYSIVLYKNHFVAATVDDIILNNKPCPKFVKQMSHLSTTLDNYISPWQTKK
jgi:hypothetical protein